MAGGVVEIRPESSMQWRTIASIYLHWSGLHYVLASAAGVTARLRGSIPGTVVLCLRYQVRAAREAGGDAYVYYIISCPICSTRAFF